MMKQAAKAAGTELTRVTLQMLQTERDALEEGARRGGRPSLSSEMMYRLRRTLTEDGLLTSPSPRKTAKKR